MGFLKIVAGLWLAMALASQAGQAQTSEKDLQVAVRSIAFMNDAPKGETPVAIIYDPANAASTSDAQSIQAAIGGGLKAGKAKLNPVLLPTSDIAGLNGYVVAFVASETGGHFDAIKDNATQSKVLTISSDLACVDGGACVVGVSTNPKVEIVVSRALREAAGIGFGSAFMMMVKER